ncbi:replication factor C, subunit 2, putative [Leishmania guyanensis]|uniref:Replication factor C, subunit 2, putative n=2 Tax=Leishmania guyanensis species complex TaxID=38579 RepID=A0A1E1J262_LEIGU|nr:replication factor C, subunit 2, putative [Leishmania guyanensis]
MSSPSQPAQKKTKTEDASDTAGAAAPWVEKYRPRTLAEVEAQEEAVSALRACLKKGANMPHFLFHGPPGTGKTTSILAVAHELFGPDYIRSRVRELNASDDRGINVVREKVKIFAQGAVSSNGSSVTQSDGKVYPVPPFKLIILDEADALLPDAQGALRRMMEDFSDVTRFCILCNYVSRIIDPIASRCAKYRFKPLVKSALYHRIEYVAQAEGITLSPASLQALDTVSGGDLRLAIMHLQSAQKANGNDLTKEDFISVSGSVPADVMQRYISALFSHRLEEVIQASRRLVAEGFAAAQVLLQLQSYLLSTECPLNSTQRGKIMLKLCQTERRLADGGDDYLQLLDIGSVVCFS